MMNNAVLRSVRYMLGLSDAQMVEIIKLGDVKSPAVTWLSG